MLMGYRIPRSQALLRECFRCFEIEFMRCENASQRVNSVAETDAESVMNCSDCDFFASYEKTSLI
jgi:hypothetical protein